MRSSKQTKKHCIALGCLNSDSQEDLTFFPLPTDSERRRDWLKIINRRDLLYNTGLKPHIYVVCSDHFDKDSLRVSLKYGSIPMKMTISEANPYSSQTKVNKDTSTDTSMVSVEDEQETQTDLTLIAFQKMNLLEKDTQDLQDKLKCRFVIDGTSLDDIHFALNLYYAGPRAYKCLLHSFKLPDEPIIKRFKRNITPNLDDRIIKSLKFKLKSFSEKEKYCVICVNEFTLRRHLYYDIKSDRVIGFQNINDITIPEVACFTYTITLKGLYAEWKLPITYTLLASPTRYREVDKWFFNILKILFELGFKIKAVMSDQGSYFDRFMKEVKQVTINKPYYMFNTKKIFYLLHIPNLIIRIRNCLHAGDIRYSDETLSWDYIRQVFHRQNYKSLKIIPKIYANHLDPDDYEKIKFKFAAQVFSRSVSAAIHTYTDFGTIPASARATAAFLRTINDLYDTLSSRKTNLKTKYQRAYRKLNYQEEILDEAETIFSKIETSNPDFKELTETTLNARILIKSFRLLFEDLHKEGNKTVYARHLNEGFWDNIFTPILPKNTEFKILTPIAFQRAFSKLFSKQMLKYVPNAKREPPIPDLLHLADEFMTTERTTTETISAVWLNGEIDYRIKVPKENALYYVSSFLFFKCAEKHRCSVIEKILEATDSLVLINIFNNFVYINKKSRIHKKLRMPPKYFVIYVQALEKIFSQNFFKSIQGNLGEKLYELVLTVPPKVPCNCYPLNYFLKLFVRFRIYTTLIYNNNQLKDIYSARSSAS